MDPLPSKISHVVITVSYEWLAPLLLRAIRATLNRACSVGRPDARRGPQPGLKNPRYEIKAQARGSRSTLLTHVLRLPTCHLVPAMGSRGPRIVNSRALAGVLASPIYVLQRGIPYRLALGHEVVRVRYHDAGSLEQ